MASEINILCGEKNIKQIEYRKWYGATSTKQIAIIKLHLFCLSVRPQTLRALLGMVGGAEMLVKQIAQMKFLQSKLNKINVTQ